MINFRHFILYALNILVVTVNASVKIDYTPSDSMFIERILSEARSKSNEHNVPLFFARKFIDKPYVAHTLEKYDEERLIVNTREFDCTTFVENVVALTMCINSNKYTFHDYVHMLERLRYRHGLNTGYTSRLHYFSDWITDNASMGIVKEVQSPVPPFTAIKKQRIYYMSKHYTEYKALRQHPSYLTDIKLQEQTLSRLTFRYIPKSQISNNTLMRDVVRNGDIIAIVSNKPGLDIAHIGFAVWHKDGLHLLNASMIHRKVIEEPMTLYKYLQKHPTHLGTRIISIINNKLTN